MADYFCITLLVFLIAISVGFINPTWKVKYMSHEGVPTCYRVGIQDTKPYITNLGGGSLCSNR